MKKILLMAAALLATIGVSAKDLYKMSLGDPMTFEQAVASATGVAIVQDGRILCNTSDGLRTITIDEMQGTEDWQMKFEEGEGELAGNYYLNLYKSNGSSAGYVTASVWSHTYLGGNGGEKANGAIWTIAETGESKYSIRNLGVAQGSFDNCINDNGVQSTKGYLKSIVGGYWNAHATWQNEDITNWEFRPIEPKVVGHTEFTFTSATLEEAMASEKPVVIMQGEKIVNGAWGTWNDGVQVHSKSDFDEKNYQMKIETVEIEGAENTYTIMLNEKGSYTRYLQASVWGHSFFNSNYGAKRGNDGSADGAVWTITALENGKYAIRSLGVANGTVRETPTQGYLWVAGEAVRIDATEAAEWSFAIVDGPENVYDEPSEEPEPWVCPEGETDITTLPWVKKTQDCLVDFGEDKGNIFGTDASTTPLSYVDLSNCTAIKVYGKPGSVVRAFINREEAAAAEKQFIFVFDAIGQDGVATFDLATVLAAQEGAEHIYLSGIKAGPAWNSTATVYGITVIEKETYNIATQAGKIGTIALDYPATVSGATIYEVVAFDENSGIELAQVVGETVAGTPYVYLASADEVVFTKTGESVEHGDFDCTKGEKGNGLVGCYSEVNSSTWWLGFIRNTCYIISNGKLRKIANGDITIPANRCFFDPDKYEGEIEDAASVRLTIEGADATAIQSVINKSINSDKIYDINGREVKSMNKGGIYVVGGMKVIIK